MIGFLALFIILGLVLVEVFLSPRIDITKEGDVLLWYTDRYCQRKYKFLFNIKEQK